ncbi:sterol binding ankyrin repeat protein [Schizosaccharomyces japonicus yFS275]|uniref:Sterol binding ankyrin repeat protein n=1 Tax=Schizosaccharomyces japonicus (strain yFS275 / FY16936) TaxID=402676 RepID=B6JYQ7_SCHJY|nr:sterol binding ankyrin repeat protein [Schizosaccharomyces japonicus yFS275]EEB06675.1 sterol binding ankyrin repeat protein [Schizosaccharomyces japonicus yFS275]
MGDSPSVQDSLTSMKDVKEGLKRLELLQAYQTDDLEKVDQLLSNSSCKETTDAFVLGIQCASGPMMKHVLFAFNVDVNAYDKNGNTPLHLAAMSGRQDIVEILLLHPDVNYNLLDGNKKKAYQVAKTKQLADFMKGFYATYTKETAREFKTAFKEDDLETMDYLMRHNQFNSAIDLNEIDVETGQTFLHTAVRNKNVTMIQWLLNHQADPYRRDKFGKLPIDYAKDDRIRTFFRERGASSRRADTATAPPVKHMSGYLKKWTNYKSGYKLRWFVLKNGVLSYYKNQDDTNIACRGSVNLKMARIHHDPKQPLVFEVIGKGSKRYNVKANSPVEAHKWICAISAAIQAGDQAADETRSVASFSTQATAPTSKIEATSDQSFRDDESLAYSDVENDEEPHKSALTFNANIGRLQIETMIRLIEASLKNKIVLSDEELSESMNALNNSIRLLQSSFHDVLVMHRDRERYFQRRLNKEKTVNSLWAENLKKVVEEQDQIEERYHKSESERKRLKHLLRELTEATEHRGEGRKDEKAISKMAMEEIHAEDVSSSESEEEDFEGQAKDVFFDANVAAESQVMEAVANETQPSIPTEAAPSAHKPAVAAPEEAVVKGVKDLRVLEPPAAVVHTPKSDVTISFHGYEGPVRTNLNLKDDRPKLSLWNILKSMIGKDMTKMTLPVSFNEPTSLLQRVAEDMEYSELLNMAALCPDSLRRLVLVGAFAASEYSSTLLRVAKPFNPLLGETFEYCRPDLKYRFIIEQVSHHPPIGAAFVESDYWRYYGESNVKSKFYGKSFDIRPLGTWYLELKNPSGQFELYTWKKITSSVVGIVLGSPTIDNYGLMEIINHTTGEVCVMDFKPRGWRGTNAYEVKGTVQTADDTPVYTLVGHWNDKLVARKLDSNQSEVVWQAHDRPPRPFNLTPFAISLNALPDSLKPWLAPTDTRFRPDQRAMELGQYDLAATEKNRLEEKQRSKRKAREEGTLAEWKPRWFQLSEHPVTREDYWEFTGEYWDIREQAGRAHLAGEEFRWPDIDDDIF